MKRILSGLNEFKDAALATVGIPTIEETKDPRYDLAVNYHNMLQLDTQQIIITLTQLQHQISNVSRICSRLGTNLGIWAEDFPEDVKNEAITIESFGKQFDNLTTNFLLPRLDPLIVTPLTVFEQEVLRLVEVRKQRDIAVQEYDRTRAYVNLYESKQSSELAKATEDFNKAKNVYDAYNEDFIDSVKRLMQQRENGLKEPARVLIAILSQFLMQLFKEAQKFRTTFPEYVLNNGEVQRKSIKDLVFAEDPMTTEYEYPVIDIEVPPSA